MTILKKKSLANEIAKDLEKYNEEQTVFVLINLNFERIEDYFINVTSIPTLVEQLQKNYEIKKMTLTELNKRKDYTFKHLVY